MMPHRLSLSPRLLLSLFLLSIGDVNAAFHRTLESTTFSSSGNQRLLQSNVDRTSSSSALYASPSSASSSMKFQNFDAMLDAFMGEPVLVYFSSVNCGPCHLQRQELAALRKINRHLEGLKILSIDTEKWPQVGSRYQIRSLPCLLVVKDKEVVLRLEGLTKAEDLAQQMHATVGLAML